MQNRLHFYEVMGTPATLMRYEKVVEQLREGRFKHMEKLHGSNGRSILHITLDDKEQEVTVSGTLNSIRAGKAARVLLTPAVIRGQRSFLLLEILENHEYDRSVFVNSIFLQTAASRNYLALSREEFTSASFQEMKKEEQPDFTCLKELGEKVDFFGGNFQLLDENQKPYEFPLVVNGAAGSGKTSVLFRLLIEYARNLPIYEVGKEPDSSTPSYWPAIYVARSARLVKHVEQEFNAQTTERLPPNTIQFLTMPELLRKTCPEDFWYQNENGKYVEKNIVNEVEFEQWFLAYLKHPSRRGQESKGEVVLPSIDPHEVYEELRLIRGMSSQQKYEDQTVEVSLAKTPAQRLLFWKFAEKYVEYLAETKRIDLDLFVPSKPITPCYQLVAADEAAIFSHAQLKFLSSLTHNNRACFAFDDHQNYDSPRSKWKYLMEQVGNRATHLPVAYRNPTQVRELLQRIIDLNHFLAQGLPHKGATVKLTAPENQVKTESVIWHSGAVSDIITAQELQSDQLVVLVEHESMIDDARRAICGTLAITPTVLTIADSIGLEFHTVIGYKLLTKEKYQGINKILKKDHFDPNHIYQHQAKKENYRTDYITLINRLGIAVSRVAPNGKLIMLQDNSAEDQHALGKVIATLKAATEISTTATPLPRATAAPAATRAGLEDLRKKLEDVGSDAAKKEARLITEKLAAGPLSSATVKPGVVLDEKPNNLEKKKKPRQAIAGKEDKPPEKKQSSSQSALESIAAVLKSQKYLTQLLHSNFAKENLKKLFTHKKVESLLFDNILPDKPCLLMQILTSPYHQNLRDLLNEYPTFALKITIDHLRLQQPDFSHKGPFGKMPSLLSVICIKSHNQEFLRALLNGNPALVQEITVEDIICLTPFPKGQEILLMLLERKSELAKNFTLAQMSAYIGKDKDASPLYWLANSSKGLTVLRKLLELNRELARGLAATMLMSVLPTAEGKYKTLHWLANSSEGLAVLKKLLELNPELARGLTAAILMSVLPTAEGKYKNTFPLYCLVNSAEGIDLLERLLELDSEFAHGLTAVALMSECITIEGDDKKTSLLYWLPSTSRGLALLAKLLDLNPKLAGDLTAAALMSARPAAAGPDENTSPLYCFTCTSGGPDVLMKLLKLNPKLARDLTAAGLMSKRTAAAGQYENTSPLYFLTYYLDGLDILKMLLELNPGLAHGLTAAALMSARPAAAGQYENTSPLYYLTCSTEQLAVLKKLLELNPELARGLTATALMSARTAAAGEYQNVSPLYGLTRWPGGLNLLATLLELNPELARGLTAAALMSARTAAAGQDENTSPLYYLTNCPEGLAILAKLLKLNPGLARDLTAAGLMSKRTAAAGQDENTSSLYHLTGHSEGLVILATLLELNPELARGLTAAALMSARTAASGRDENTSSLFYLTNRPEGLVILTKLLELNPELARGLTATALMSACTAAAGEYENTSPLYYLAGSPEGLVILTKLLELNPELARGLTATALMSACPAAAGAYENTSSLYYLTNRPKGLVILAKLLELNPELARGLTATALMSMCTAAAGEYANTSPLYYLTASQAGLDILMTLLKLNPDLARGLTAAALLVTPPRSGRRREKEFSAILLKGLSNWINHIDDVAELQSRH